MDKVYTVWDFYDSPRTGIAEYCGSPHYYSCQWNEAEDEYATTYTLQPIDSETLALALKNWTNWCKWARAFDAGQVSQDSHPAIVGNDPESVEIKQELDRRISALPPPLAIARPTFIPSTSEDGVARPLFVEW